MADTGEDREIKERADAKEAEVVAQSKKLLRKSIAVTDQALDRRRRVTRGKFADKPIATWLLVTHITDFHNTVASFGTLREVAMAESRNQRILIVDNDEKGIEQT